MTFSTRLVRLFVRFFSLSDSAIAQSRRGLERFQAAPDGWSALLRTSKADVHDMGEAHRSDAAYFGRSRVCSIRQ